MEKLIEEIDDKRTITKSTLNMYKRTLNNIAKTFTNKEFKNINFLKNKHTDILKKMEEMSSSKKKNYLATILVALSPKRGDVRKGYEKVYKKYKELLSEEHATYEKRVKNGERTQNEKDNMVDMQDLHKVRQKYENNIKHIGYTQKTPELKKKKPLPVSSI